MEVADDLPESPAAARSEWPAAGATTCQVDTNGCGAAAEPATGSATRPAAGSAAVPAARTAAVPAARPGRRRPIRRGGGRGDRSITEGPGQRQEGEAGT